MRNAGSGTIISRRGGYWYHVQRENPVIGKTGDWTAKLTVYEPFKR
jgi:hypothetical protein